MAGRKPLIQVQKEITDTLERINALGKASGKVFAGQAITEESRPLLERVLSELSQLENTYEQLAKERHRRIQ